MNNVFRPSRQYRRQFAGRPCPACGNVVAPADLVAFAPGGRTYYLHASCVELAVEAAAANGAAAGSTDAEEERGGNTTAAEPIVHAIMDPEEGTK